MTARATDEAIDALDDYVSGALSDALASVYEEALFEAAAGDAAPELAELDALNLQVAWFSARGGLISDMNHETVTRLRALPRVHYIEIEDDTHTAEWPADTELVVYRVAVDLRDYEGVDVELRDADGRHLKWFRDCPVDPSDGALYGICDAPIARSAFRIEPIVARVMAARRGETERRLVAELRVTPA